MPINGLYVPISGGNERVLVVIKPFSDDRPDTTRCGMQKNAYYMDTADAVCKTDPGEWMAQLLADELQASGFYVSAERPASGTNALILEGSIIRLFVEPVRGMWTERLETDIEVKLTATSDSGLYAERNFFAKGIKKGRLASTSTPYHVSLKRAADEILSKMIEAVFDLMDKYPGLGKPDLEIDKTKLL